MSAHAAATKRPCSAQPDLSVLDAEQASALEQIAGEALIGFGLRRAELRGRCRQAAPEGRYAADSVGHIEQVRRLEQSARRFLAAAHARSRAAERERCRAVRAVESFAGAAVSLAPDANSIPCPSLRRRCIRLPASTESLHQCAREP